MKMESKRVDTYVDDVMEFFRNYNNSNIDFNENRDYILWMLEESVDIINDLTKMWE
jgi:hypothetical protein